MNNFLIILWCVTKSGCYIITGNDQLCSWPEKQLQSTSQSQSYTHTHTHKRSWSLFGGLLLVGSITAFWIPAKPLHLKSMCSKSLRCTENCNTCSKYWSKEKAQFCRTMPDHTSYNQCFKNWTNWSLKFNLIHHIHPLSCQPPTTSFKHLDKFLQGKCFPHLAGGRKYFPRVRQIPKLGFLRYRNKQIYFSLVKMC